MKKENIKPIIEIEIPLQLKLVSEGDWIDPSPLYENIQGFEYKRVSDRGKGKSKGYVTLIERVMSNDGRKITSIKKNVYGNIFESYYILSESGKLKDFNSKVISKFNPNYLWYKLLLTMEETK